MLPVAILFIGVLLTILIGVQVLVMSLARTAVQSAADAAVSAAQVAGEGHRESEGVMAGQLALLAARSSVSETRRPVVTVEAERGSVRAVAFGAVITPLLGREDVRAVACGPLDDVPASQITSANAWQC